MKICLISTASIETPPSSYAGMERMAWYLADGLAHRGHEVHLLAKPGSARPLGGYLYPIENEREIPAVLANNNLLGSPVFIDFSHDKVLSNSFPRANMPICNLYQVMSETGKGNAVFISREQKRQKFKDVVGPIIYYGLPPDEYPMGVNPTRDYLLYMGQIIPEKRIEWACEVALKTGIPLKVYGPWWGPAEYSDMLRNYAERSPELISLNDSVGGVEKLALLQNAKCLIHPPGGLGWVEAGAIVVLEALMCGTPIVASRNGAMIDYLENIWTPTVGILCDNVPEMIRAVGDVGRIDPNDCRARAMEYSQDRFVSAWERLTDEVSRGSRW